MGAKNSEQSSITYLKLKAKTSDTDPTPYIGQNEKTGNGWAITKTFNSVDGELEEITSETYEYEGEQKNKCKMKLRDKDGSITILESNFNNMLYSILNSLAGSPTIGFINIDVWLGKSKGDTDKRYAQCAVKNNGEKTAWLYDWQNVPKPRKVLVPGTKKTVTDDTAVVDFWNGVIKDISEKLKNKPKVYGNQNINPKESNFDDLMPEYHNTGTPTVKNPPTTNDDNDSLPF